MTRKRVALWTYLGVTAVWIVAFAVLLLTRPDSFNFGLVFGPFAVAFGVLILVLRTEFAEVYNDRMRAHRWMEYLGPVRYSGRSLVLPALGMIGVGAMFILTGLARLR